MRRGLVAFCALLLAAAPAPAGDQPPKRMPFSDDKPPPPPLPVPLDRHLKAEIREFDGERIRLRWDWSDEAQLEDFDRFVPVRATLSGGFEWKQGHLDAQGTGGIHLRLAMESDLELKVDTHLRIPHDLGVVLARTYSSDESVLCLLQDKLFTAFDAAAGNTNMINKLGAVPPAAPGMVEFRYVARSLAPELASGDGVALHVIRKGDTTTFVIAGPRGDAVTLKGKDPSPSFSPMQPGLYTSGGSATFGPLEISGRLDARWLAEIDVLPHVASNLLHPGNRFKGRDRKAAEQVEAFLAQPAQEPEEPAARKNRVDAGTVVSLVGDEKLPLVIRIRAAEAIVERGAESGAVVERIAQLLDARDLPARVLAWQVLRPELPWHFDYEPDAEPKVRAEAALLVGHFLRERDYAQAEGKIFIDGYWYTPSRADAIRGQWERAWDLRTPRVRVKTNLPYEWAIWYVHALEAEYRELVRLVGREPPPEALPISVLVFARDEDYRNFCSGNGYPDKIDWGRFVDLDVGACFVTFQKHRAPLWALNQSAKLFHKAATGRFWPTWYDEGRASWFGNGDYLTATWDGTTLQVGQVSGLSAVVRWFRDQARADKLWTTEDFLAKDPRNLAGEGRKAWYCHAWALHHWLLSVAPEDISRRFARWQGVMENLELSPKEVDETGRRQFVLYLAPVMSRIDEEFGAWVRALGK